LLAATGCLADTRIRNNVPSPAEYMKNIRVTNGTFVAEGGAPYLVMLLFKKDVGYGLCGGTIIDPTTIITAGHCVYNRATSRTASPTDAYVFYGS
ncbi:Serine protease 55, partial [Coemansia sp. RSA 2673]